MISEIEEPRITEAPKWFPEEEPKQDTYWACTREDTGDEKGNHIPLWRFLFRTAEEAEAHACSLPNDKRWKWNGKPASKFSLIELLKKARYNNDLGVKIIAYQNGDWITIETYPVGIPLL